MAIDIQRREFMTLFGGAVVWPLAARAQQPALPVIGYLNNGSPESDTHRLTGLRRGLNQTGYVPIVIAAEEFDPVEVGLITSISRPGGNITGVIFNQVESCGKRVERLKEVIPGLSRVAVFVESGGKFQLDETQRADLLQPVPLPCPQLGRTVFQ